MRLGERISVLLFAFLRAPIVLVIDFFHKYPILKLIMNMNGS